SCQYGACVAMCLRFMMRAMERRTGPEAILDVGAAPAVAALPPRQLPPGTRDFLLIVGGQVVSSFGTGLTTFALGVWTFRQPGRVTEFALIGLFSALPAILFSPIAGALADRWDRRRSMMLSDAGAALMTLLVAVLLLTGSLTLPVLYGVMIVTS